MRLAADEITITVEGTRMFLRPTLRAGLRLERRYGFPRLLSEIAQGNLSVITDVIREAADCPHWTPDFCETGLRVFLDRVSKPREPSRSRA